jgi:ABC-type Fe3+ transport system permease subunit
MARFATIVFGTLLTVGLMVLALFAWFQAPVYASAAERPDVLRWAVRSLAIAAAAGAQLIAFSLIVGPAHRRRTGNFGLRVLATIVCCAAAVTGAALGVAARG